MTEKFDALIEVTMLREEVKQLKAYTIRLERENAQLMDRLSHRRPSSVAETEVKRFCRRCAKRLLVLGSNRRAI